MVTIVRLSVDELINGAIGGRKDFTYSELEEGADLSGHARYEKMQNYLRGQSLDYHRKNPINISSSRFRRVTASGLYFPFVDGYNVDFQGAILKGADFRGAILEGANLEKVNLLEANLKGANLEKVNLLEANLREAKVRGADFLGAILRRANLEGTDFQGANLRAVDLREARNLKDANLKTAIFYKTGVGKDERAVILKQRPDLEEDGKAFVLFD